MKDLNDLFEAVADARFSSKPPKSNEDWHRELFELLQFHFLRRIGTFATGDLQKLYVETICFDPFAHYPRIEICVYPYGKAPESHRE
ncbi:hypothetical protein FRUB_04259 [Fimbriiglobus ruber]|uniref:Uncharacterized protein n=2 Tax=Fimbriiglobus ruber TaxID=1908690 RepID=A0A225DL63_9BACT|nr:hypothetical protein FRUB_04259 [Fimbriiglobus ruber]